MTSTSFAQGRMSLKSAIDDYMYAVTVEWDQTDLTFLHTQDELLRTRIESIANQITDEEISEVFPEINFDQIKNDPLLQNISTTDQLRAYMATNPVQYYQGANWLGEVIAVPVVLGIVGVFVYLIYKNGFNYDSSTRNECINSGGNWSMWGCYHGQ
jgi:hypothetical protein